jgi:hypothetical protein
MGYRQAFETPAPVALKLPREGSPPSTKRLGQAAAGRLCIRAIPCIAWARGFPGGRAGLTARTAILVRERTAPGRRAVGLELRSPRPCGRRDDLGEPGVRRPAVPPIFLLRFHRVLSA